MFLSSDLLGEYWILFITTEFAFIMFTFATEISVYRGAPGFVTGCPCSVWSRGLNTCTLYVSPLFGKSTLNKLVYNFDGAEKMGE